MPSWSVGSSRTSRRSLNVRTVHSTASDPCPHEPPRVARVRPPRPRVPRRTNRISELEEEVRRTEKASIFPNLMDQLDEIRERSLERIDKLKDILAAIQESSATREP